MRVLFLAIGDRHNPGTRYRVHALAPFLRARGHEVRVVAPLGASLARRGARRLLRPVDLARDLLLAPRWDLVVVYRKTFPGFSAGWLRRRARGVAFDFDDAIYLPAPSEPQGPAVEARYRRNFAATVAVADLVIAGNRLLAGEVRGRPVEVVPTAVDLAVFRPHPRRAGPGFVVGWVGTAENLAQWERLLPAFRRLVEKRPQVRFKVISSRPPGTEGLPVAFERFAIEREAAHLADVDVGIMPLEDTPWNRGKCSAKALQAMAMGRPVVVSPVGMNREVVEHGRNGYLAAGEEDWVRWLGDLADSPERAEAMGREARRTVEERYALGVVAPRVVELLEGVGGGRGPSGLRGRRG